MPEKQYLINSNTYMLNVGEDQEERVDYLISTINKRIEPYSRRFSEYSETYLMLLLALEFADELDRAYQGNSAATQADMASSEVVLKREKQLQELASRAEALVKKAQQY